jgi:hypothetical protein
MDKATDPEINELRIAIAERQEAIAELELDLSDTRSEVVRFELEYEAHVGHLQRRLEALEDDLVQVRHRAAHRAQWGQRADDEEIPDVMEQFRRTWTRREEPAAPPAPEPPDEVTKEELKKLFRTLAKMFHPDLVTESYEKKRRADVMAKINKAYAAGDAASLKALLEVPSEPEPVYEKTRAELVAELRSEVRRLDGVIRELTFTLHSLTNSDTVKLMLDVSIARQQGRELLVEMAKDLTIKIERVEEEIAALK